eukprot:1149467-Pelagomonas_calceolata.AAC.15
MQGVVIPAGTWGTPKNEHRGGCGIKAGNMNELDLKGVQNEYLGSMVRCCGSACVYMYIRDCCCGSVEHTRGVSWGGHVDAAGSLRHL